MTPILTVNVDFLFCAKSLCFVFLRAPPTSAPRIITLLETMDILLDHNATFICEVESRPPAVITWTKNNEPIM